MEALQAWRRANRGEYPHTLSQLADGGFIDASALRCPVSLKESPNASASHSLSESTGDGLDRHGMYTYQLTAKVEGHVRDYMGASISWRDIKSELLRREAWEQVPLLRCSVHRDAKPATLPSSENIFRNFTASGLAYWSGDFWESEWPKVPPIGRQALVVTGLRGPPFHRDLAPDSADQLDLRAFYNACGERAWWWGLKYFQVKPTRIVAPDLGPLFDDDGARSLVLGGCSYWIDGVIQLQGKVISDGAYWDHFVIKAFPSATALIPVRQHIESANVLLGCVWKDKDGKPIGNLVWRYVSGVEERTPFIYGQSLRRLWRKPGEDQGSPAPVFQSPATPGGSIRLYAVACVNPRPAETLAGLRLEAYPDSPAAPFILAITVKTRTPGANLNE